MSFFYRNEEPTAYLTVSGKFPGLNDYILSCRKSRYAGAELKKEYQSIIEWTIKDRLGSLKIENPVDVCFFFKEPNKRRDRDNIAGFFHKVFFDALVSTGTIKDDGWDCVHGYEDSFEIDKENPGISILIYEGKVVY